MRAPSLERGKKKRLFSVNLKIYYEVKRGIENSLLAWNETTLKDEMIFCEATGLQMRRECGTEPPLQNFTVRNILKFNAIPDIKFPFFLQ